MNIDRSKRSFSRQWLSASLLGVASCMAALAAACAETPSNTGPAGAGESTTGPVDATASGTAVSNDVSAIGATGAAASIPAAMNEAAMHIRLKEIAAEYKQWSLVNPDDMKWAPTRCYVPPPPGPAFSESIDHATHGGKLYFLYAKDDGSYLFWTPDSRKEARVFGADIPDTPPTNVEKAAFADGPGLSERATPLTNHQLSAAIARGSHGPSERDLILRGPGLDPEVAKSLRLAEEAVWRQPVGQVIVKEAHHVHEITTSEADVEREKASSGWAAHRIASKGGKWYRAGDIRELYVMYKVNPATPGTDRGWIYGTLSADGKTVTSAGLVSSCMGCHADAEGDRIFGYKR